MAQLGSVPDRQLEISSSHTGRSMVLCRAWLAVVGLEEEEAVAVVVGEVSQAWEWGLDCRAD